MSVFLWCLVTADQKDQNIPRKICCCVIIRAELYATEKHQSVIILTDVEIAIWVLVWEEMFISASHFHHTKQNKQTEMIMYFLHYTKQTFSFMAGEYDL